MSTETIEETPVEWLERRIRRYGDICVAPMFSLKVDVYDGDHDRLDKDGYLNDDPVNGVFVGWDSAYVFTASDEPTEEFNQSAWCKECLLYHLPCDKDEDGDCVYGPSGYMLLPIYKYPDEDWIW